MRSRVRVSQSPPKKKPDCKAVRLFLLHLAAIRKSPWNSLRISGQIFLIKHCFLDSNSDIVKISRKTDEILENIGKDDLTKAFALCYDIREDKYLNNTNQKIEAV